MDNEKRNVDFLNVDDIKRFIEINPAAIDKLLILDDKTLENVTDRARWSSQEMTEEYGERKEDLQLFFALHKLAQDWVENLSESDYNDFYSKHKGEPFDINQIDPSHNSSICYMDNDWMLYGPDGSFRHYSDQQIEEVMIPELGRIKKDAAKKALEFRDDMKIIKESIDDEKLTSFYEMANEIEKQRLEHIEKMREEYNSKNM